MGINKKTITDQVYSLLLEKIIKQELVFGEQINPREFAAQYGISVMPVRDALLKLTNKGLVINKPRIGFFVRSFESKEIAEIMEVRKMYEVYCAAEHFENINRKILQDILNQMLKDELLPRGEFDKLDIKLHNTIIYASHNEFLINKYNNLFDIFYLFRYLNLERYQQAYEDHKEIIKSILDNNPNRTITLLAEHIDEAKEAIILNLKKSREDKIYKEG